MSARHHPPDPENPYDVAQPSRIYFLPNLMTAGNLCCGFVAVIFCIKASYEMRLTRASETGGPRAMAGNCCTRGQLGRIDRDPGHPGLAAPGVIVLTVATGSCVGTARINADAAQMQALGLQELAQLSLTVAPASATGQVYQSTAS